MREAFKAVVAAVAALFVVILFASIAITYVEEKYAPKPVARMSVCGVGLYKVATIRVDSSAPVYLKEVDVGGVRYKCPALKLEPGKENLVVLAGSAAENVYGYVCTASGPANGTRLVFLSGVVSPEVLPCPEKGLENAGDK